jgi:hypothetical protein
MVRLKPLSYAFIALILFALLSPHNEAIYEHFGIIPTFPENAKAGTTSIVRATTTEILMNKEEHNKKKTEQGIDNYLTKIQEEEEQISDHKNTREPFILDYNRLRPPIELVSTAALWLHGLHIAREV